MQKSSKTLKPSIQHVPSTGTDIPKIYLSLYFMICVKRLAWYCGRMYTSLLFSSGRLSGSFNVMICQGLLYVSYGVLISGHKLDSESDTFDVSKHGKHFYLLEHDHKVNFVSSPGRVYKDGSACRTF